MLFQLLVGAWSASATTKHKPHCEQDHEGGERPAVLYDGEGGEPGGELHRKPSCVLRLSIDSIALVPATHSPGEGEIPPLLSCRLVETYKQCGKCRGRSPPTHSVTSPGRRGKRRNQAGERPKVFWKLSKGSGRFVTNAKPTAARPTRHHLTSSGVSHMGSWPIGRRAANRSNITNDFNDIR